MKKRRLGGSRTTRRAGTNGKNIPGRPKGASGRVLFKYRFPRRSSKAATIEINERARKDGD